MRKSAELRAQCGIKLSTTNKNHETAPKNNNFLNIPNSIRSLTNIGPVTKITMLALLMSIQEFLHQMMYMVQDIPSIKIQFEENSKE